MSDKLTPNCAPFVYLITSILWDVRRGIYKDIWYWSDGRVEERFVPKGVIVYLKNLGEF